MPKPAAEINQWICEQELRLGIGHAGNPAGQPTVTLYPGERTIERLAHFGADRLIANNAAYAKQSERLDAELAEIIEGVISKSGKNLRRSKSTRAARVLMNDYRTLNCAPIARVRATRCIPFLNVSKHRARRAA